MADIVRVRLDLDRMAANVSKAEGKPFTCEDAERFIQANGFTHVSGDTWLCEEISLGLLDKSEILTRLNAP